MTKKFTVGKYMDLAVAKITDKLNISLKKKNQQYLSAFIYSVMCLYFTFISVFTESELMELVLLNNYQ